MVVASFPDAASIIAGLHAKTLRLLAQAAGRHFEGLAQASRDKALGLTSRQRRRLLNLDTAFNVSRHISAVSADLFFEELVLLCAGRNAAVDFKKQGFEQVVRLGPGEAVPASDVFEAGSAMLGGSLKLLAAPALPGGPVVPPAVLPDVSVVLSSDLPGAAPTQLSKLSGGMLQPPLEVQSRIQSLPAPPSAPQGEFEPVQEFVKEMDLALHKVLAQTPSFLQQRSVFACDLPQNLPQPPSVLQKGSVFACDPLLSLSKPASVLQQGSVFACDQLRNLPQPPSALEKELATQRCLLRMALG